jgi:hypothetical protein
MFLLKLSDSPQKIEKDINAAIAEHINISVSKNKNKVQSRLQSALKVWIRNQPEIASLLDEGVLGTLNAQFGLPNGAGISALDAIVNSVARSIQIKLKINNNLSGSSVEIFVQPQDFQNLLSLSIGHVVTEKSTDLHWLNWLLTMGDTVIITGYSYSAKSGFGRSGGGTMSGGGSWRIDPKYSGTIENNFITRAFEGKDKEIAIILAELLS